MKYQLKLTTGLICFAVYIPFLSLAQADKQLDGYNSVNQIWWSTFSSESVTPGFGSVTTSYDASDVKEGDQSLLISYSFNGIAPSGIVAKRTFSTYTQDLSFFPQALSLWVKGQTGLTDYFAIWLYIDNDMDGNANGSGDAVFWATTGSSVLGNPNWTKLTIPYSNFTKYSGNGTLNLNRILGWGIGAWNVSGKAHNGIIKVDDLRQVTTYQPVQNGTSILNGMFIQVWDNCCCMCGQWNQARWEQEFDRMKNVCLDKVIINFSVYSNIAWYTPSGIPGVTVQNPTINSLMTAAENKGMKIILGLHGDSSQVLNKLLVDELWDLFGSSPAFNGWYLTWECNEYNAHTPADWRKVGQNYRVISDYAQAKQPDKEIIIAPFYGPFLPADKVTDMYDTILKLAPAITEVLPQDKVGDHRDVDVDVPQYMSAIKSACIKNNRKFGVDIEVFRGLTFNPWTAGSADINSLKKQLWESGELTNELIAFDWSYIQPGQDTLFSDYKLYANQNCVTTSIEDKKANDQVEIYPNPAMDYLQFATTIRNEDIITIRFINSLGQEVMRTVKGTKPGKNQLIIDTSSLPKAVYHLQIQSNNNSINENRLIIVN